MVGTQKQTVTTDASCVCYTYGGYTVSISVPNCEPPTDKLFVHLSHGKDELVSHYVPMKEVYSALLPLVKSAGGPSVPKE